MRDNFAAIRIYALAYAEMERLQRCDGALFPVGDQKTGVIAEFFARLFAANHWPQAQLAYGSPSEHAWDITVRRVDQPDHKIQVKAVSCHSQTSRISPIHPGWHELYLLRLNESFFPIGFWTLRAADVSWGSVKLGASTMPKRGVNNSGSKAFRGAFNRLDSLLEVLAHAQA